VTGPVKRTMRVAALVGLMGLLGFAAAFVALLIARVR
jgi:hypothetical protein